MTFKDDNLKRSIAQLIRDTKIKFDEAKNTGDLESAVSLDFLIGEYEVMLEELEDYQSEQKNR